MMNDMKRIFAIDDIFYFLKKQIFCLTTFRDYQSHDYNEIMLCFCLYVKNINKHQRKQSTKIVISMIIIKVNTSIDKYPMLNIASKTLNTIIIMMTIIIKIITITVTTAVMLIIVTIIAITSIFGYKRDLALTLHIFYILYDIVVIKAKNQ